KMGVGSDHAVVIHRCSGVDDDVVADRRIGVHDGASEQNRAQANSGAWRDSTIGMDDRDRLDIHFPKRAGGSFPQGICPNGHHGPRPFGPTKLRGLGTSNGSNGQTKEGGSSFARIIVPKADYGVPSGERCVGYDLTVATCAVDEHLARCARVDSSAW